MHNLEIVNGQASMVFNSRHGNPWHKLGTAVDGALTAEQALTISGQNWEVLKKDAFCRNPVTNQVEQVPACAIYRSDNGIVLGIVGPDYAPIQNATQFEMIDYLLTAEGGAHYDTAGVLGHGERVWTLARLPQLDLTVAGDKHESFLLACTSHDMSLAFTLKLTAVRVVCQNTLTSALSSNGALAKVKHTRNASDRLEKAKRYMELVRDNSRTLEQKLNILASRRMTRESMTSILDKLFPASNDDQGKAVESTRRDNVLADVLKLYESNDGNANPAIRGSAYNLLNAVTEYTDHLRSSRVSSDKAAAGYNQGKARWESAFFGSGEALKSKAVETILTDTVGNPVTSTQYFNGPSSSILDDVINNS